GSRPGWGSRPWPTSASPATICRPSWRARRASSPTISTSTATTGRRPRSSRRSAPHSRSRGGESALGGDEDALQLGVVHQAFHAELLADARGLVAAERRLREDRAVRVDADRAGAKRACDPELAGAVPRPQRAGQAG